MKEILLGDLVIGILPVIIAAFAYPLGNRKMMEVCDGRLDTFQRVFESRAPASITTLQNHL